MDDKNNITLEEYIKNNYHLLSILGVFIALTVFFSNIDAKGLAPILSFLALSCVILIWLETWSTFPSNRGSWKLTLFENALTLLSVISITYWVIKYHAVYGGVGGTGALISIIILSMASYALKKFNFFNRAFKTSPGGKKALRYAFGITILAIALAISIAISGLISPYINTFLDQSTISAFAK